MESLQQAATLDPSNASIKQWISKCKAELDKKQPVSSAPISEAVTEKEKGNDAFARKDYTIALLHYNKAIELDSTNHGNYYSPLKD
jgi:hypothetical protein